MQGDSEVVASVGYTVQAKFVGHVSDTVFFICLLRDDRHGSLFTTVFGKGVAGFSQITAQDLHQAMSIAVIMDGASFTRRPYKHQLYIPNTNRISHGLGEAHSSLGSDNLPSCSCHSPHRRGCGYIPCWHHQRHICPIPWGCYYS